MVASENFDEFLKEIGKLTWSAFIPDNVLMQFKLFWMVFFFVITLQNDCCNPNAGIGIAKRKAACMVKPEMIVSVDAQDVITLKMKTSLKTK